MGKYSDMAGGAGGGKYSAMVQQQPDQVSPKTMTEIITGRPERSALQKAKELGIGIVQGLADVPNTLAQALEAGGSLIERGIESATGYDLRTPEMIKRGIEVIGMAPTAAEAIRSQQEAYSALTGDSGYATAGRIGGQIAATAPLSAIRVLEGTKLAAPITGAIQGGLASLATSSAAPDIDPGQQGMAGAGIGAAAQTLLPPVARAIAKGAQRLALPAQRTAEQLQKEAAIASARGAGYVLPPTMAKPSLANKLLEGFAGKLTTGQQASLKNQPVTNRLARQSLGVSGDEPLTVEMLNGIRQEAGQAYEAIKATGMITADDAYVNALNGLEKQYQGAAQAFPGLSKPEVSNLIGTLKQPTFDADAAIDAIRVLREVADGAYSSGNKGLGKAAKGSAEAMENLVERHLLKTNQIDLLKNYKSARQLIAKTYTIQKALNTETGDVSAKELAKQLHKGKPLTDELRTIAGMGAAFEPAARVTTSSMPGLSPWDYMAATVATAASQNPLGLAGLLVRPAVRNLILSQPYQTRMLAPEQTAGMLRQLMQRGANLPATQGTLDALLRMQQTPMAVPVAAIGLQALDR